MHQLMLELLCRLANGSFSATSANSRRPRRSGRYRGQTPQRLGSSFEMLEHRRLLSANGSYEIVEAQYPVFGVGGHDLLALLGPDRHFVQEIDGAAYNPTTKSIERIGIFDDNLVVAAPMTPWMYSASDAQIPLYSGSFSDAMNRWEAALVCAAEINDLNLPYPFFGLGSNSNSVASTLVDCAGLNDQLFHGEAWLTPGKGTVLLNNSTINEIQDDFGITPTTEDSSMVMGSEHAQQNSDGSTTLTTIFEDGSYDVESNVGGGLQDATYSKSRTLIDRATETTNATDQAIVTLYGDDSVASLDDAAITLEADTHAEVFGERTTVDAANGDYVTIGGNGPDGWTNNVTLSYGGVQLLNGSRADIKGNDDAVDLTNDDNFGIVGNNETIVAGPGAGIWATGAGDSITGANGDYVTIGGNGPDGWTNNVTLSYGSVQLLNGSRADIKGNDDSVNLAGNDNFGSVGGNETIVAGPGTGIWATGSADNITGANGDYVTIGGNGPDGWTNNVTLSYGSVLLQNGSRADLKGNDDSVNLTGNDNFGSVGSNETIVAGPGTGIWNTGSADNITGANGDYVTISGNGSGTSDIVNLAGGRVNVTANSTATVVGPDDTVTGGNNDTIDVGGFDDSISAGSASTILVTSGSGSTINAFSGDIVNLGNSVQATVSSSGDTIILGTSVIVTASGNTIVLGSNAQATIDGSHDTINGGASDVLNIAGQYNQVTATTSAINYTGTSDTGDDVSGVGDSGSNWADGGGSDVGGSSSDGGSSSFDGGSGGDDDGGDDGGDF